MYTPPDCTMPKQQKRQNKSKKNAKTYGSVNMVPRPLIAVTTMARLGYVQSFSLLESASGIGAFQTFRLNDLYDPDFTGTGAQPAGFDQLCLLYSRFRVVMVDVEVHFGCMNGSSTIMALTLPSAASTLSAGCQSWLLQPYSRCCMLGFNNSGASVRKFQNRYDPAVVLGLPKAQYMDEMDFTCTASNSPLRPAYFHVAIYSRHGIVASAQVTVRFVYHVQASSPVVNDLS